jgi:Flp pilus assembly protein TadD
MRSATPSRLTPALTLVLGLSIAAASASGIRAQSPQTTGESPTTPPAAPALTDADALNALGIAALQAGQLDQAIAFLEKATSLAPQHRFAWNNLGRAYIAARRSDDAIAAFDRQIAINPNDEYSYANKGLALVGLGRREDALVQFRKQLEITPLDKFAHAHIGRTMLGMRRFPEAIESLERAVGITPGDAGLWVGLGHARLGLGQLAPALEAFDRAAAAKASPSLLNQMAWELAEKGLALDRARDYAQQALDRIAAILGVASLEAPRPEVFFAMATLAATWDTMGWIRYKSGDSAGAEPYLRAAWQLAQHGEVGEHLAELHERAGDRARAIETYARAATALPARQQGRRALERLVGSDRAAALIEQERGALAAARTVALPALVPGAANGEVLLSVRADGVIGASRFVSGDAQLRAAASTLEGRRLPAIGVAGEAAPLVRVGMVTCQSGCTLVLLSPDAGPPSSLRQ